MTVFEILSLVVAFLALAASLGVWFGQRKLQREANELQRVTAELSRKQIALIDQQEALQKDAHLSLALEEVGRGHRLVLLNHGPAAAHQVTIESLGTAVEDSLLLEEDVKDKFPVRKLLPGASVSMYARIYMGSPSVFHIRLTWFDGREIEKSEDFQVSL